MKIKTQVKAQASSFPSIQDFPTRHHAKRHRKHKTKQAQTHCLVDLIHHVMILKLRHQLRHCMMCYQALCHCLFVLSACYLIACSDGVIQRIGDTTVMPQAPMQKGFLILNIAPKEAKLYLNGRYMGKVSQYPRGAILLTQQDYHIQLSADGYGNWYGFVKLDKEKQALDVKMLRIYRHQEQKQTEE